MAIAETLVSALKRKYPDACRDAVRPVEEVFGLVEKSPLGTVTTPVIKAARDLFSGDQDNQAFHEMFS